VRQRQSRVRLGSAVAADRSDGRLHRRDVPGHAEAGLLRVRPRRPGGGTTMTSMAGRLRRAGIYAVLVVCAGLVLLPLFWLLTIALMWSGGQLALLPHVLPELVRWDKSTRALTYVHFLGYARSSVIIGCVYSGLVTLSWSTVGFAMAGLP